MINLEQLLANGSDYKDRWVDLLPSPSERPLGRALVSVTALEAMKAIQIEAENEPPPPPPLPEGVERWRTGLRLASLVLRSPPEHPCWYALRVLVNGDTISSRSYKCDPTDLSPLMLTSPLPLPVRLERLLYLGPATPLFARLISHAAGTKSLTTEQETADAAAADAANMAADDAMEAGQTTDEVDAAADACSGLSFELVERADGGWLTRARGWLEGSAIVAAPSETPLPVVLQDSLGSETASLSVCFDSAFLARALLEHLQLYAKDFQAGDMKRCGLLPPRSRHLQQPSRRTQQRAREEEEERKDGEEGGGGDDGGEEEEQDEGGEGVAAPKRGRGMQLAASSAPPDEVTIDLELSSIQLQLAAPSLPPGARLLFEATIGTPPNSLLHSPISSRLVRAPTKAGQQEKIGCKRSVVLARQSPLWKEVGKRLVQAGQGEAGAAEFYVTVYSINPSSSEESGAPPSAPAGSSSGGGGGGTSASGRRRKLGVATHSLRGQLLRGTDAVHEALDVCDVRGVPIASLWVCVTANAALTAVASTLNGQMDLPSEAEQRKKAADRLWNLAMAAIKLQSMARSMAVKRRKRLAAGDLRHSIKIHIHELRLPFELCKPDVVNTVALQLEVGGIQLITPSHRAGTFRPRAGRLVLFEIYQTIDLERDSPAYAKLAAALSSSTAACELRAILTAERLQQPGTRALTLASDARFTMGDARVDLRVLLASGSDLLEKPLPVRSKARTGAMSKAASSPILVVSFEGIDALDAIARAVRGGVAGSKAARQGAGQPTYGKPALKPQAEIAKQRWRKVALIQAMVRGHLTRRMTQPRERKPPMTTMQPGMEHVQLQVRYLILLHRLTAFASRSPYLTLHSPIDTPPRSHSPSSQVAITAVRLLEDPSYETDMLLGGGQEFSIELNAADLSQTVRAPFACAPCLRALPARNHACAPCLRAHCLYASTAALIPCCSTPPLVAHLPTY